MGKTRSTFSPSEGGKLPIVIPEGKMRALLVPITAKFASEGNKAVRNHVPVRSHWNKYKEDTRLLSDYYRTVAVSTYCMPLVPLRNIYINLAVSFHILPFLCMFFHVSRQGLIWT